jgi:hypothetical protein
LPDGVPTATEWKMASELRQEVSELTELMRDDESYRDIRDVLAAKGLSPADAVLAGLISGEDNSQYGVLVLDDESCVLFATNPRGSLLRWETVRDIATLETDFRTIAVGLEMKRNGEIS